MPSNLQQKVPRRSGFLPTETDQTSIVSRIPIFQLDDKSKGSKEKGFYQTDQTSLVSRIPIFQLDDKFNSTTNDDKYKS